VGFVVAQEVARQRGGYGEERYEKEEFQNKVLRRSSAPFFALLFMFCSTTLLCLKLAN